MINIGEKERERKKQIEDEDEKREKCSKAENMEITIVYI